VGSRLLRSRPAPPRTKAYLQAEIEFVLQKMSSSMAVLELGCGYGRVLLPLLHRARSVVGIDTSMQSLRMATEFVGRSNSVHLAAMDAAQMGLQSQSFDLTICIQNGISAFGVDQKSLFAEAVRVTRSGGVVLFSSYAERFWAERLKWFEIQAEHGLIGEIDYGLTGDGVIVCKDGFRATTIDSKGFRRLAAGLGVTRTSSKSMVQACSVRLLCLERSCLCALRDWPSDQIADQSQCGLEDGLRDPYQIGATSRVKIRAVTGPMCLNSCNRDESSEARLACVISFVMLSCCRSAASIPGTRRAAW